MRKKVFGGCAALLLASCGEGGGNAVTAGQPNGIASLDESTGFKTSTASEIVKASGGAKTEFETSADALKRISNFADKWNSEHEGVRIVASPIYLQYDAEKKRLMYSAGGRVEPVPATKLGLGHRASFFASSVDRSDGGILTQKCEVEFEVTPAVAQETKSSSGNSGSIILIGKLSKNLLLDAEEYFDLLAATYKPPVIYMSVRELILVNQAGKIVTRTSCK